MGVKRGSADGQGNLSAASQCVDDVLTHRTGTLALRTPMMLRQGGAMPSHAGGCAGGHGSAVPPATGAPARPGEKVEAKRRWDTTSECAPAMRMVWDHRLSAAGVKWALILYEFS
jgi:hypothetical protein